jgi:integrase
VATIKELRGKRKTTYNVQIRLRGMAPASATFERKSDARRWAQETEAAIRQGRYFQPSDSRQHTVAELIDKYLSEVLDVDAGRRRKKRGRQLLWWREKLGHLRLAEVTPSLIGEWRERLRRGGHSLSGAPAGPATQTRYLAALSHAFSQAVREWGWLESSPLQRVRRPAEPRGRVRYLSAEERTALLAACQASPEPRLLPLVVLALSTGARQGELMGLKWRDVDVAAGVAIAQDAKNGERRRLTLAGRALEVVRDLAERRGAAAHLFTGHRGGRSFPQAAWKCACRAAGLSDFRFHDLRHSAASYLAMNGATLAEIAEVLGHLTLQMVKRYAHLSPQHTSAVVARMNEQIFGQDDAGAST